MRFSSGVSTDRSKSGLVGVRADPSALDGLAGGLGRALAGGARLADEGAVGRRLGRRLVEDALALRRGAGRGAERRPLRLERRVPHAGS